MIAFNTPILAIRVASFRSSVAVPLTLLSPFGLLGNAGFSRIFLLWNSSWNSWVWAQVGTSLLPSSLDTGRYADVVNSPRRHRRYVKVNNNCRSLTRKKFSLSITLSPLFRSFVIFLSVFQNPFRLSLPDSPPLWLIIESANVCQTLRVQVYYSDFGSRFHVKYL